MDILIALIGLAGVTVTASGGVIVAMIGNRKNAAEQASKNTDKILEAVAEVKSDLSANSRATVATTRGLISDTYWRYKDAKQIPEPVMRNIMDLHEAYKGIQIDGHTPNSWCDSLVDEMKTWKII